MTYLPCIANVYLRCHMYQATAFNRKILYSNQIKSYLTCHNCRFICPPPKKNSLPNVFEKDLGCGEI